MQRNVHNLTVTFLKRVAISHSHRICLTDSVGALRQVKFNVVKRSNTMRAIATLQPDTHLVSAIGTANLVNNNNNDNNNKVIDTLGILLQHLHCTLPW